MEQNWGMNIARILRILLACIAAVVVLGSCAFAQKIEQLTVDDVGIASVKSGEYRGSVKILPVTATVRVTVKDGAITEIDLVRHFHGPDHGADAILGRVMAAQSLAVDAVAGATYSSKVVLKAIEQALKKGQ